MLLRYAQGHFSYVGGEQVQFLSLRSDCFNFSKDLG